MDFIRTLETLKTIYEHWKERHILHNDKVIIQGLIDISIEEMFKTFESQSFYKKVNYSGVSEYENVMLR